MMGQLQLYRLMKFKGGAGSYAGQGICSVCHKTLAEWMGKRGAVWWAYCDDCKDRLREKTKKDADNLQCF